MGWKLLAVLATLAALGPAPARAAARAPRVQVWDVPGGTAASAARDGWRAVAIKGAARHHFAGGVALENKRLLVICAPGAAALTISTKTAPRPARAELVVLGPDSTAEPLKAVRVAKVDANGAVIRFTAGAAEAEIALGAGRVFVEFRPGRGAATLEVRAETQYALIPDFFGDDLLFDPGECRDEGAYVPSENFLLGLGGGGRHILMYVWPRGEQRVHLLPGGGSGARRFSAVRAKLDGKAFYVALLEGQGLWHGEPLSKVPLDKDVPLTWTPPFPARWRTDIVKTAAADLTKGARIESWDVGSKRRKAWHEVLKHRIWPSWVDKSGKAFLYLAKDAGPYAVAVTYPMDRARKGGSTPASVYTLVDIVRDTLGVEPCEYILDVEGLKKRSSGGGRKMHFYYACGSYNTIQREVSKARRGKAINKKYVAELAEDGCVFMETVHARVEEYRAWAGKVEAACREAAGASPKLKPLAERALAIAGGIARYHAKQLPAWKTPAEWRRLNAELLALVRDEPDGFVSKVNAMHTKFVRMAQAGDTTATRCRMVAKQLRQEVAMAAGQDAQAIAFAEKIRGLCREILRNKHYKEGN